VDSVQSGSKSSGSSMLLEKEVSDGEAQEERSIEDCKKDCALAPIVLFIELCSMDHHLAVVHYPILAVVMSSDYCKKHP
jgi:hypothetical protein